MRIIRRIMLYSILGLIILCLAVVLASALSNLGLPTELKEVDRLSEADKARLVETIQLRQSLGDKVWPGWEEADIPIIVYNSDYAFLVGYPDPPSGWKKVPGGEQHGGTWEQIPDDTLGGQVYYRLRLPGPEITPQAFTVQVGEAWVASFQTRDWAQISLVQGFRQDLPAALKPIFPYRLLWWLLMGDTEVYIGAIQHEAFHAYQGLTAPQRLIEAERSMRADSSYPYEDAAHEEAWQVELEALFNATQAKDKEPTAEAVQRFLALRNQRRAQADLSPESINLEQQREWEEGLAKYAELEIQRQAAMSEDYEPLLDASKDPDFNDYTNRLRYWNSQLSEVRRMDGRKGETRFYYTGFVQAVLLDRLAPGWKAQAFEPGVWLEDLLREATR